MNKRNGLPGADAADVFEQKIGRTDMQELEKILEEIEDERADVDEYSDIKSKMLARHWNSCIFIVQEIIRKHMNDGWIPVEERLPEDGETVLCTDGEYVYLVEYDADLDAGFGDMDGITDWQQSPKPYRPERSKDGQAD